MRRNFLFAMISILLLMSVTSPAISRERAPAAQSNLELPKSYILLSTRKTSTMQIELNAAAASGYRVVVGCVSGFGELIVLLEKVAQSAEPYEYLLLATTRTSTMQRELDESAAKGFRLLPSAMMGGGEVVLLLEKPPGPLPPSQYLLLATNFSGTLQTEVARATEQGYQSLGFLRAEQGRSEHIVLLERPAQRALEPSPSAGPESKRDAREFYRLLASRRTATMQNELTAAARSGYRVVGASPTSGTEIEVLMEKTGRPGAFEYRLLATANASTLQKELNQSAASGFRLLRQTLVGKRGAGSGSRLLGAFSELAAPDEIVAILERGENSATRYDYLVLDGLRTSTMQREILKAEQEGYGIAAIAGGPRSESVVLTTVTNLRLVLEKERRD